MNFRSSGNMLDPFARYIADDHLWFFLSFYSFFKNFVWFRSFVFEKSFSCTYQLHSSIVQVNKLVDDAIDDNRVPGSATKLRRAFIKGFSIRDEY